MVRMYDGVKMDDIDGKTLMRISSNATMSAIVTVLTCVMRKRKYYLCDVGYTTMPDFISPYRGVRYHLNEHKGRLINNKRELFNLIHSSLRSKIESTFGLLKNRFKLLTAKPHYPFPTQVDVVLACTILHNYITIVDPGDDLLNEDITIDDDDGEIANEGEDDNVVDFTQNIIQREERDSRNE
ncbi:uncharacterized protein LOC109831377 [Asparagus officinalis]|uniref:uncharacterized protein LOC109831377 n=1 Tax=Asparagus officinalis TaxID=4686 RepID=UPI00098DEBF1|nr:uncharacterized protein LOC109831377 [Asparagus officinalis]